MKTFITILISVIITAGAAGLLFKLKGPSGAGAGKATEVHIEHPARGKLIETINAPGQVEPKKHVEISARISARIESLPFEEGDVVTKGDLHAHPPVPPSIILQLDATDLEAGLRSAQARRDSQAAQIQVARQELASQKSLVAKTQASLDQARLELQRQMSLLKTRDVSEADVDQARTHVTELEAELESSHRRLAASELGLTVQQHNLEETEAGVSRAQEALKYTTITSPIDGVVTRINAEVGEVVMTGTMNNPGTVIMEIADLSEMIVVAQVDERDVAGVAVGQQAEIRIHAWPDRTFTGVLESLGLSNQTSNTGARYFEANVLLAEADVTFRSGLTADVDIAIKTHENVLRVPSQAVLARDVDALPMTQRERPEVDRDKTLTTVVYTYRKKEDNDYQAFVTPVAIGPSDAAHTIIESGVTEEDWVIVGSYKVLEGLEHEQAVIDEKEVEKKKKEEGNGKKNEKSEPHAAMEVSNESADS